MISTEPGPRLGRERLRNGGIQCEPVRDENLCAAWISTVSSTWHEPLILTTDQEVGGSSPFARSRVPAMPSRETSDRRCPWRGAGPAPWRTAERATQQGRRPRPSGLFTIAPLKYIVADPPPSRL